MSIMGATVRLWSGFAVIAIACVAVGQGAESATGKPDIVKVCNLRPVHPIGGCGSGLEVDLNLGFSPRSLPPRRRAPIALFIAARIFKSGEGSPPGLTEARIDIDRHVEVDAQGLPACGRREIETAPIARARRACGDAIVGAGHLWIERPSPESESALKLRPSLIAFNGGTRGGVTTLLLYSPASRASDEPFVEAVKIKRRRRGVYGWEAVIRVSRLALANDSITGIQLYLKRRTAMPVLGHVLSAACSDGRLLFRVTHVLADDTVLAGAVLRSCISSGRRTSEV